MSQTAIATAIVASLSVDTSAGTFHDDVSGRIRWLVAEQAADVPLFTFQFTSDIPDRFFDGTDEPRDIALQLDLYTSRNAGPDAHDATKKKARVLLDRQTLTVTGFGDVQVWIDDFGSIVAEDNALRSTMTATVMAQ